MAKEKLSDSDVTRFIEDMPDEVLTRIQFSVPWQYSPYEQDGRQKDEDGFYLSSVNQKDESNVTRETLQRVCWDKFHRNPQLNTSVRGLVGRLTGLGFETTSGHRQVQEAIEEIENDPRNRLYDLMPKYVGRFNVEGELYLALTCHIDGFIEIDFIDPETIRDKGDDSCGIIYHPNKTVMPLFYTIKRNGSKYDQIPSIFVARYPELARIAAKHKDFDLKWQENNRNSKRIFKKFGGYYRFIVNFDKGFVTRRAVSYLRTTLEWLNYYENLKKYEIDHKKSSGAYVWTFKITEPRMFKMWLGLSDEEKKKTGILAPKTPGGSLVLPPGMELEVNSPTLPQIREQDTDIMEMVTSGLNEPNDVTTGRTQGSTYASVKASRGPMSDRVSDEIAYFERFLRFEFWGGIFFLKSEITDFPKVIKVKEAVGFDKTQEPIMQNVKKKPQQLIEFSFPVSETIDLDSRAKGLLGVKHGPISETIGIPKSEVSKKMGFGNYTRMRLMKATEDETYPELEMAIDAEAVQEAVQAEPSPTKRIGQRKSQKPVEKKE
jgi:hypothetical protein